MNNYYKITLISNKDWFEIFTAILSEIDFEMFEENSDALNCYIQESLYDSKLVQEVLEPYMETSNFKMETEFIPYQNWNATWEANYEPIFIDEETNILAPFHSQDLRKKFSVIIQPQMSFGTGHHPTTFTMMQNMKNYDFTNKSVLDFGCGTGVLAIYAELLGARNILAVDYDAQCAQNSQENILLNNVSHITVKQGDINVSKGNLWDFILANITRNTIIEYISEISTQLEMKGYLICSGIFESQLVDIQNACQKNGLDYCSHLEKEGWVSAVFQKNPSKC